MNIERVQLKGVIRINPDGGAGYRDVEVDLDYVPGDGDTLGHAALAKRLELQQAAMMADATPVSIPLL